MQSLGATSDCCVLITSMHISCCKRDLRVYTHACAATQEGEDPQGKMNIRKMKEVATSIPLRSTFESLSHALRI